MKRMYGAIDTETRALILTVDAAGLEELVELLRRSEPASVPLTSPPDHAATRPIRKLRLEPREDGGVASVATVDDVATITGNPTGLARLAGEIRQFGAYNNLSEPGMHAHFDPGVGEVLAQDSEPFIVAGPVADDTGVTGEDLASRARP
jgi:hypothetical protein